MYLSSMHKDIIVLNYVRKKVIWKTSSSRVISLLNYSEGARERPISLKDFYGPGFFTSQPCAVDTVIFPFYREEN